MLKIIQFVVGLLLLIATEIFHVYFIMPMPGSQEANTIDLAYFIHNNLFWFRMIGLLIILFPTIQFLMMNKWLPRILVSLSLVLYIYVFYLFNYKMVADKMFLEPTTLSFAKADKSSIKADQLVIGVEVDGKAKAYPIQLIGYHHQVRDTLAGKELMVTYCTVCRTGRAYVPEVNGMQEKFRLVGMDHFNAMFEDATTGTWWRQVNGEAIVGPLKGSSLKEVPSTQMTLRSWLDLYPDSQIMQPDTIFNKKYEWLSTFDRGTTDSHLLHKDSLSWNNKSWIVGVQIGMQARAYDWEELLKQRVINDTLANTPIVVAVENDSLGYHVFARDSLTFRLLNDSTLADEQTNSIWSWNGKATSGALAGSKLPVVQSYQEFWHSWRTFRPQTTRFEQKK